MREEFKEGFEEKLKELLAEEFGTQGFRRYSKLLKIDFRMKPETIADLWFEGELEAVAYKARIRKKEAVVLIVSEISKTNGGIDFFIVRSNYYSEGKSISVFYFEVVTESGKLLSYVEAGHLIGFEVLSDERVRSLVRETLPHLLEPTERARDIFFP